MKNENQLMSFRAAGIGISAALLALACGSSDNNNSTPDNAGAKMDVAPTPVAPPVAETCSDNPLLAGCSTSNTPAPGPTGGTAKPVVQDEAALAKAAAENVLAANCGQCHGKALTPQQAQAGMNYIDNIDELVKNGKIIPLDAAGSRIIQRMVKGEMPPVTTGRTVTEADINIVSEYINNPRFWPGVANTLADCTTKNQLEDFDHLFQDANRDLLTADNKDIPFYRYIAVTNRFTAGVCATALDKDRDGMTKMMNMLSVNAKVATPTPVNADETLYRIDLRDFDWDRGISVNGTAFADVWEAIAAVNPYAVQWTGDDADQTIADTQTNFPIMLGDSMMDTAIIGNLYYAIINVDVNQPLSTFITDLGIDLAQNIIDEDQLRAGTTKSRISRQDRLVERDDIEIRDGALWQSFDFEANNANQSIFQDPFNFTPGGTEAIFTLPNGMLGFIIADANQVIKEDSDILLDTNQNNFRAITSVSCSNCHATGLIPVVDEVGPIALANARTIGLNRDQVEELQNIYVSPTEFAAAAADDSTSFYQRALQKAQLPVQGGDPVSNVFLRFDQDVTLNDAAGDLGLLPSDLKDNLNLLNPVLDVLNRGTLDRDDFTEFYVDSLCKLSLTLNNQPVQAVCDQAAAAADAAIGL